MCFLPRRFPIALACLLLAAACFAKTASAEDPKKTDAKPATKAPAAKTPAAKEPASKVGGDDVLKKWEAVVKRRDELAAQLSSISQPFQSHAKGKQQMIPNFEKLMKNFRWT